MFRFRKAGVAALAAMTIAAGSFAMTSSADARSRGGGHHGGGHHGGHHGHHGHGHWGGAGLATGLALGVIGAGMYGAHCWQDRVVGHTRHGRPIVQRVNVC